MLTGVGFPLPSDLGKSTKVSNPMVELSNSNEKTDPEKYTSTMTNCKMK